MGFNFLRDIAEGRGAQVGALCSSSRFLARKMIAVDDMLGAETIAELGAGDGAFTHRLIKLAKNLGKDPKKMFFLELDPQLCKELRDTVPSEFRDSIYCMDVRDLPSLLHEKGVVRLDLIISGLPFVSLPKELFISVMNDIYGAFAHAGTIFKQFTYISPDKNDVELNVSKYAKYAAEIIGIQICYMNLPPAIVLTCRGFEKKTGHIVHHGKQTFHGVITQIGDTFDQLAAKIKKS